MSAILSPCKKYRYRLGREWSKGKGCVLWVMLNPSTADALIDDPTITRCIGFSKNWGYRKMIVGNLFAFRTPHPKVLWNVGKGKDVVGPDNDKHLKAMLNEADLIVFGWGGQGDWVPVRVANVKKIFKGAAVFCLRLTDSGQPFHPLYQPGSARLKNYPL